MSIVITASIHTLREFRLGDQGRKSTKAQRRFLGLEAIGSQLETK